MCIKRYLLKLRSINIDHKNIKLDIVEKVNLSTIDLFCNENKIDKINLLKIDVEGHESQVITGGRETILKSKPMLLVEIEKRHLTHLSMEAIFRQILELGYTGFFLKNGHRKSLSEFSYELHQEPFLERSNHLGIRKEFQTCYINNFIFEPK